MKNVILLLAALALPFASLAQTAETTEGEATAEDPPEPVFNGRASGLFISTPLDVPVVCTGMGSSVLTAQSDPGETPSEDVNGDQVVVNVTASTSGEISMAMLAGGISLDFADTSARVEQDVIRYKIIASITGGADERIDLTITCN